MIVREVNNFPYLYKINKMSEVNPNNPPPQGYGTQLFDWIVANILWIKRRLNAIGSGSGGGTVGSLQQVTTVGNTTTRSINILDADGNLGAFLIPGQFSAPYNIVGTTDGTGESKLSLLTNYNTPDDSKIRYAQSSGHTLEIVADRLDKDRVQTFLNNDGFIELRASQTVSNTLIPYYNNGVLASSDQLRFNASLGVLTVTDFNNNTILLANALNNLWTFGDIDGIANLTYLAIDNIASEVTINGNKVSSASHTTFTGSGLDNMTNTTTAYTGMAISATYTITLEAYGVGGDPNTFSWTDGITTVNGVTITGATQVLNNGVTIMFATTTGQTVGDTWSFTYTVAYGAMLSLDGQNQVYAIGDVNEIANGGNFTLSNNADIFNCTAGTSNGNYLSLNEGGNIYGIGDLDGVNNGLYDQVDDGNKLYKRSSSKTNSSRLLSTSLESLTADRTRTEPDASGTYALVSNLGGTITTPAYGTTVDLSAVTMVAGEIRDIEFASGTGATGLLLPTGTNAAIGAIVIVGDLLAISLTSNIVVDAGASNTINAATIAQTQTMNVSGSCWTLKKITATAWKLQ